MNQGGQTGYFTVTGMESGTGIVSTTTPEPIVDTGLDIEFPVRIFIHWHNLEINIPNTIAPNYLANYNAYQCLRNTNSSNWKRTSSTRSSQCIFDRSRHAARPEDVATAQAQVDNAEGAVQIAEAAYENTIITAPADGTIVSVAIALDK